MLVFFVSFIVYLYTLFPSLSQYRDSGEMVSAAFTLGVAHPPGYPLYIFLSKFLLGLIPLANAAYRMNVFSAIFSALSVFVFYRLLLLFEIKKLFSVVLALLFGFSYLQWYLSLVAEMYTLNTLFALLSIYLFVLSHKSLEAGIKARYLALGFFVFGLGLGNRLDIVMLFPVPLFISLAAYKQLSIRTILLCALFGLLGATVYLFLMYRSSAGPLLDWNHPADFQRLLGSLMRKTHGGTLDLVSASYGKGENFAATGIFYLRHILSGPNIALIGGFVYGIVCFFKKDRFVSIALLAAYIFSGPVFIYMANMPPNPHALAILEAHFLQPNLFFFLLTAAGIAEFARISSKTTAVLIFTAIVLLTAFNLKANFADNNKRWNLVDYDYIHNLARTLPIGSAVIMKKDVQLFSLWYETLVSSGRKDILPLSQGLSGSFWYITGWKALYPDINISELKDSAGWMSFVAANRDVPVFFTNDADVPPLDDSISVRPAGIANCINNAGRILLDSKTYLNELYVYRGKYNYDSYKEFFTPDLIDDYSKARFNTAQFDFAHDRDAAASHDLKFALALNPLFPMALNYLSYLYFSHNNFDEAIISYEKTTAAFLLFRKKALAYNAEKGIIRQIDRDLSDSYVSLGAAYEKKNFTNDSINAYNNAMRFNSVNSKAYYNLAVVYWKANDFSKVVPLLRKTLELDPGSKDAQTYLHIAEQKTGIVQ